MAIRFYKSTDASAPQVNGLVGTLIPMLDACLVNGYGTQSPLGWTKPYSSTNAAVYRPSAGVQFYVQVNDNGPTAGAFKEAQVWGFETMTAYNTGTGMWPSTGVSWYKNLSSGSGTTYPWWLWGDDRCVYMTIQCYSNPNMNFMGFGDFISYKPGDAYNVFLAGGGSFNSNGGAGCSLPSPGALGTAAGATGFYAARSYTGVIGGGLMYTVSPMNNVTMLGGSGITYPNATDGGCYMSPVMVAECIAGGPIRGRLRGVYVPLHNQALADATLIANPTGLPGTTLQAGVIGSNNVFGQLLFDTTGPW